ncbi:MAG: hypothetical protein II579_08310 [Treponema sp.]|nr:hypothetical protein [Treponema sp.]
MLEEAKVHKNFFSLVLILLAVFQLHAQEKNDGDISFETDSMGLISVTIQKDKIVKFNLDSNEKEEYPASALKLNANGYYYFTSNNNKRPIIFGNKFFGFYLDIEKESQKVMSGWFETCKREGLYYNRINRLKKFRIEFSSSSHLADGKNVYEAQNLKKLFFPTDCVDSIKPYWNPEHKPWAEGVKGNGEGEYIEIESENAFGNIMILNGYVDIERLDLYKKNSRVKVFTVEDLDNNITSSIKLADEVVFQDFKLQKPTKHIRLTIKEVYKGNKWEDTCVSSIIPY